VLETLDVKKDKGHATLRLTVKPIAVPGTAEGLWLIIFEELPFTPRTTTRGGRSRQSDLVRRLEGELRTTKKEQQRLIEQLESGNEELKAANEEILSMNEELQSTNEELVTSKEELQSMNEELTTLNAQLQDKVQELTAVNDDMANLLVSTDIATVFIDTELRIKRFTTAATHLLNLLPSDVGRPINHMATNLVDIDLGRDARAVLSGLTPIEKEVVAQNGKQYVVRMLPYRTEEKGVQGVVLTLVDVTALKNTERELREARDQVSADFQRMRRVHEVSTAAAGADDTPTLLNQMIRAAIEVTGADVGNIQLFQEPGVLTIAAQHGFAQPFLDFFKQVQTETDSVCGRALATRQRVAVEDVCASPIFAGSEALAVLQAAGVHAVQSTPLLARSGQFIGMLSTHFRTPHVFDEAEFRWLDLLARQASDLIVRRQAEESVVNAQRQLEQRVADRTKWLTLMHAVTRAINEAPTWDEALHLVLRRICEAEQWQMGYVYLPDKQAPDQITAVVSCFGSERLRPFYDVSMNARYARGESLPGRVYAEGVPAWINSQDELVRLTPIRGETARQVGLTAAAALPVAVGANVIAVLELFSDHPHERTEELANLLNDVSTQIGRVLERERLTTQVADLVWREQQELLHTLHDSLGQTLTGLGMLSSALHQRLTVTDPAAVASAQQIAHQAQQALEQLRRLSRGLFPVEVDSEGLIPALRQLALTTESLHKVHVQVESGRDTPINDPRVATQLYRIAQEAVTNAVRHAQPRTIRIEIGTDLGATKLRVIDDGVGIRDAMTDAEGMGLRIMNYRAASVGATLSVEPGAGGGTVVTCTLREAARLRTSPTETSLQPRIERP
jgi:signal transduction histidine kinase